MQKDQRTSANVSLDSKLLTQFSSVNSLLSCNGKLTAGELAGELVTLQNTIDEYTIHTGAFRSVMLCRHHSKTTRNVRQKTE